MAAPTPGTCSIRSTRIATGTDVAWQNVGVNYTFGANGQMNPSIDQSDAQQRDGERHLARQCAARSRLGRHHPVRRSERQRAGQPAAAERLSGRRAAAGLRQRQGSRSSAATRTAAPSISPRSRSRTSTAPTISSAIDGGAFEVTDESGPAIYGAPGKIVGSSLEGSNTDIADEFTKLIVTQQAYSANTRVISQQQSDGSGSPEHAALTIAPGAKRWARTIAGHEFFPGARHGRLRPARHPGGPVASSPPTWRTRTRRATSARRRSRSRARPAISAPAFASPRSTASSTNTFSGRCGSKARARAMPTCARSSTTGCRASTALPARPATLETVFNNFMDVAAGAVDQPGIRLPRAARCSSSAQVLTQQLNGMTARRPGVAQRCRARASPTR